MRLTDDELDNLMYRCDRAIGKLREERLSRSNATEMIGATMALMNRLHQDKYARNMARKAIVDEAIDDSVDIRDALHQHLMK
jgi:hypothetical protein